MTPTQIAAWYQDPSARRVLLIEAIIKSGGSEITRYMSVGGYRTVEGETPASTVYPGVCAQGEAYNEQLSLTNTPNNMNYGDIEIENLNGERDDWLKDIWMNRPVKVWLGDASWARSDFFIIFDGTMAGIASKDRGTLAIKMRDKLQRLNTPISEHLLGGSTVNKGSLIPLCFGECFNISPLLVDSNVYTYQVHDGIVNDIFDVRDNGIPVQYTKDLTNGKFTLTIKPVGVVTCSVQGDSYGGIYRNTVASVVYRIVTGFGKSTDRFTDSDIDLAQTNAFDAAHTQKVGIYIKERANVLKVCQDLCASLDAQIIMTRTGLMRILQIAFPGTGTEVALTSGSMFVDDIVTTGYIDPVAAIKIGFDKNWTVQEIANDALSARDRDFFLQEWLSDTQVNSTTQSDFRINTEPTQLDSMLKVRSEVVAEGARQLALWSVPRYTYSVNCEADMMQLELGQALRVYNRRYQMSAGVPATVISLAPQWSNFNVKVGFIV